uniref:RHS repeat-associated core domain-containing protein n=1 Tax=Bursaphelenchus xylophilus TaxID=6326 RepID=A0A1I7SAC4_BURXY
MSTEIDNVDGVDAHYAYFRSVYGQLSDSIVGVRLRNIYDYTKNSNEIVQKSLNGVETRLYDVSDSFLAPLYERYCYPTTERLAKASVTGE